MRVVYIDELFLLNFAVNFLLLLGAAHFSGLPFRHLRLLVSAGFGGLYATAAYLSVLPFIASLPVKLGTGVLMVLIGFGFFDIHTFFKRTLIFFLISLLFGGGVMLVYMISGGTALRLHNGILYTPISTKLLIGAAAVCYGFISFVFDSSGKHARGGTVRVRASVGAETSEFSALVDTGNSLRDPLSGDSVIVAELAAVGRIFSKTAEDIIKNGGDPVATIEILSVVCPNERFRLIPYRAVGTQSGFLLAMKPEKLELNGKRTSAMLAISPVPLGGGAGFHAIAGDALISAKGKGI